MIIDIDYRVNAWKNASAAALRMKSELSKADILVGNDDEFAVLCGGDKDEVLFWQELMLKWASLFSIGG